jgi:hypothetical protein
MTHMNDDANNFLTEVLAEAAPADFRDAMLGETLRLVRRRRRWRQSRQTAGLLVALGLCGILVWQANWLRKPTASAPAAKAVEQNYRLVRTQPLPASAIVATQPLAAGQLVAPEEAVKIVQTRGGNYRLLNDAELLALLGPRPAVLIRTGPHSEELVFANPEDEKGFPLN